MGINTNQNENSNDDKVPPPLKVTEKYRINTEFIITTQGNSKENLPHQSNEGVQCVAHLLSCKHMPVCACLIACLSHECLLSMYSLGKLVYATTYLLYLALCVNRLLADTFVS